MGLGMSLQTRDLLSIFLRKPGEWRYGYDLSRASGLKSGTLYPILIRLTERAWLESEWRLEEGQKPRRMYRLTAHGRAAARLALKEGSRALNVLGAES